MLLLAKKVNLDKTVRNMAVWDRTDPSRGRKLMSTWQKGWTRLPLFFPHKLGQGRGTEEVILQLWRAFQSVTLRTFFKLNQIWVTPVTGACNIQGYSQCKAFLPPAVWVIPQCPYERPGRVSAARSHTGPPAPSPSPSSAARSAAPPSVCWSGPLGLHTWCASGWAPCEPQSASPEVPVRNTT